MEDNPDDNYYRIPCANCDSTLWIPDTNHSYDCTVCNHSNLIIDCQRCTGDGTYRVTTTYDGHTVVSTTICPHCDGSGLIAIRNKEDLNA